MDYTPCTGCEGDGCAACDGAGYFAAYVPTVAPIRPTPALPHAGPLLLTIATDGWAVRDRGTADEHCYRHWALCASADGVAPLSRYRNGGPVGLLRPVSGKAAPGWMHRAVSYVARCGGLPMAALPTIAEWFRSHRTGEPDGAAVDVWAAA